MNKTKLKELSETSKVIKFKKGYRYLWIMDLNKVTIQDVTELKDYLEEYDIYAHVVLVDGNPDKAVRVYEAEVRK